MGSKLDCGIKEILKAASVRCTRESLTASPITSHGGTAFAWHFTPRFSPNPNLFAAARGPCQHAGFLLRIPLSLPAHLCFSHSFFAPRTHLEKQHSMVFSQYFLPPRDFRSYKWTKTHVILTSEDFKSLQKKIYIVKKA